jgi:arylsulfatase A
MREGGSRVPLIVSQPGTTPAGKVCNDLIDFTDFFPTLAEATGGKLPAGVKLDGRSFAAQMRGERGNPRDWVYIQLFGQRYVRSHRWKLNNEGQFFDMRDAPFRELSVSTENAASEISSARGKLETVLSDLLNQDEHKSDPSAAKKARK